MMSFDVDAESVLLAIDRRCAEHPMIMSHQAYGPRVGVPRILAMLEDLRIKATFFIPGYTVDRYPDTVGLIVAAGHEIGHHSYSHRSPPTLSDSEERADFERALEAFQRVGVTPKGHRAAVWDPSWRTLEYVAEYGLLYDSSLMDDDKAYRLQTSQGTIAELPPHWSLDDWQQYFYLPDPMLNPVIQPGDKVLSLWRGELDGMRRHGCLYVLTNHPFISGRPGRVETLRQFLEYALSCGDVQFRIGSELAEEVLRDQSSPERYFAAPEIDGTAYPVPQP
jgi:peptidoglycan/xylan/chitin deacetylase (PgdA/CDA1 family)